MLRKAESIAVVMSNVPVTVKALPVRIESLAPHAERNANLAEPISPRHGVAVVAP